MAYYNSNYYEPYNGESYQTPYGGNYSFAPSSEASMGYSSHGFYNQNLYGYNYNPTPYNGDYYNPTANQYSFISYSKSPFTEAKSVMYDPYSDGFSTSSVTQFRVSYSVSGFNEPEYEEYDPTPYDGGYDMTLTYGKPLPPSLETCYPPHSNQPETKPEEIEIESKIQDPNNGDENYENQIADSQPLVEEKGNDKHNYGNYHEYDQKIGGGGAVGQIPPGYGLEAMDICEGLFGYWPCLDRYNRRNGHGGEEKTGYINGVCSSDNQYWKESVDYFFGNSDPYAERFDGNSIYGYQSL